MRFYSDSAYEHRITPILEIGEYCFINSKDLHLDLSGSDFTGTYSWDKESKDFIIYPNVTYILGRWEDYTFYINGETCQLNDYGKLINKKGCLYNG